MAGSPGPGEGASSGRPIVLLVEDHDDTRMMYAEFLSLSFEVLTAGSGTEALETLRRERPDLLITDLSLPGLDGSQLIARVRADPATSRLPIVCLSGYGGDVHEQRAREAGADRMLQKPCMPDTLTEIVLALLDLPRPPER